MRIARPSVLLSTASVLVLFAAPVLAGDPIEGNSTVGAELFKSYCRSCHGSGAQGDGPVAQHLKDVPADLTQIARRNDGAFPREWVHKRIDGREKVGAHGSTEMPVWGDALSKTHGGLSEERVQQRIADLVAYIESVQTD